MTKVYIMNKGFVSYTIFTLVYCLSLFIINFQYVQAMPASPQPYQVKQPDGSTVWLHLRGDEHFHWLEDRHGYSVVKKNKSYVYARLNARKRLSHTDYVVGKSNPKSLGIKPRLLPPAESIRERRMSSSQEDSGTQGSSAIPSALSTSGTLKNLVVLIRFSNHQQRSLPSPTDLDVLFNKPGGDAVLAPTGSVRDVYFENSYGQLIIESVITNWIDLPDTEQEYANRLSGLSGSIDSAIITALDNIDGQIDFNEFDRDNDGSIDAITFIHSGYDAVFGGTDSDGTDFKDRIWSHKSNLPIWVSEEGVRVSKYNINPALWGTAGTNIGRIGVIAHELGHYLGLPDLYDVVKPGQGIGSFGLMANAWGFDGSQWYPPHFSPWSKIRLGWSSPVILESSGTYSIKQAELNDQVFRIDRGFPEDEYLLIENRQPTGFDAKIPQGGLVIWHIDEQVNHTREGYPGQAGWPENGNHYRVAVLQADGRYNLEKGNNRGDERDVYHALGINEISFDTVPNTNSYQSGNIIVTDNTLTSISVSDETMSFTYFYDIDRDLIPDDWELVHGMNPADPTDAQLDFDNDGFSNIIEYLHGTLPNDADSIPIAIQQYHELFENNLSVKWDIPIDVDAGWNADKSFATQGALGIRSADITTHSQVAAIEFTSFFAEGVLSFDYRVSSEPDSDFFKVYIDGQLEFSVSGQQQSVFSKTLSLGVHTIRFAYEKDANVDIFEDAAWIDNLKYDVLDIAQSENTVQLHVGLNLIAIPENVETFPTVNDWMSTLGDSSDIKKVQAYNRDNGQYITLIPEAQNNEIVPLVNGESFLVYSLVEKEVVFNSVYCATHDLKVGMNIVGFSCSEVGNSAFDLLDDLGIDNAVSIQRFYAPTGRFESAAFNSAGVKVGNDFPINLGEGYFLYMKQAVQSQLLAPFLN